jgi:cytochrome b subunit of formate dehydrogenase
MRSSRLTFFMMTFLISLSGVLTAWPAFAASSAAAKAATPAAEFELDNASCLTCHESKKGKIERSGSGGSSRIVNGVSNEKFGKSVHAKMQCLACHAEILDSAAPHKKSAAKAPDCANCHEALWQDVMKAGVEADKPRLETVAKNIESYKKSFHAQPDKDTPSLPKARCTQCHDTHAFNVPADRTSEQYAEWRREVPQLCGNCHREQLETYSSSIHGTELFDKKNIQAPICISCHTTHEITDTALNGFRLLVTEECGSCHKDKLASYRDTYHGQASKLGGTNTAKCYNCHGSHGILPASDPKSMVNVNNRLKTCQTCHDGKTRALATAGFVSFGPHANSHDFAKYPQMWVAAKLMQSLLILVFTFFWVHSGLWYLREWKDRKERVAVPHIRTDGLPHEEKFSQRISLGWRITHLAFALVTLTLVLTGTSTLFSHTAWAPVVVALLGGTEGLALIHRIAAALFLSIFVTHFVYVMQSLLRDKSFGWFGPNSLIPNKKDLADCIGMFKWFLGKGPKPRFERWTYFEKFDYWAVFIGVCIIGISGLMLVFPTATAKLLPGWVFNVATVVHGEDAFLGAVLFFTAHFFNNNFRPNKLPPQNIVMVSGLQPLEAFRAEHPAQYQRLMYSGELDRLLVDGPSQPLTPRSRILALVLIAAGLTLLVLVVNRFVTGLQV